MYCFMYWLGQVAVMGDHFVFSLLGGGECSSKQR